MTAQDLRAFVRDIPDFPRPGILFRDITPLLLDAGALDAAVGGLADRVQGTQVDLVVAAEARGFIFAAPLAIELGAGFVPVRKPGKLPVPTIGVDYALEYGRDRLEIDPLAIRPGQRVVIVDDLIATGGTALAATELLREAGATVSHAQFVIDLPDLHGAARLRDACVMVEALMEFAGH